MHTHMHTCIHWCANVHTCTHVHVHVCAYCILLHMYSTTLHVKQPLISLQYLPWAKNYMYTQYTYNHAHVHVSMKHVLLHKNIQLTAANVHVYMHVCTCLHEVCISWNTPCIVFNTCTCNWKHHIRMRKKERTRRGRTSRGSTGLTGVTGLTRE